MKGNLGIVSVHHIKLNEKFLQREKKTEEEEEAEEAIQRSKETLKKRGENGKKKKIPVKCFPWWLVPANLQRGDERQRDRETRAKNGDSAKEQPRRN